MTKVLGPSSQSKIGLVQPVTMVERQLKRSERVTAHNHPWAQLLYAKKGVLAVTAKSNRYIIAPQQAIWLPEAVVHQVDCLSDVELSSFYIDLTVFEDFKTNSCRVIQVDPLLQQMMLEAHKVGNTYDWNSHHGRFMSVMIERIMLAKTLNSIIPCPTSAELCKAVSIYMQGQDDIPDLAFLANQVGLSQRTLTRRFKAETGIGFQKWRQLFTIEQAITKLAKGESIKYIALDLGYQSVAAFTYMFRKHMGCPPSEYLSKHID